MRSIRPIDSYHPGYRCLNHKPRLLHRSRPIVNRMSIAYKTVETMTLTDYYQQKTMSANKTTALVPILMKITQ